MVEVKRIRLNKNRGWRGLAELVCEDSERKVVQKVTFSFSQDMWNDLLKGYIVTQDKDFYYVLEFDNLKALPKPTQQRSVLIKNFIATVISVHAFQKENWLAESSGFYYKCLYDFKYNTNKHTVSDWNAYGMRVKPEI